MTAQPSHHPSSYRDPSGFIFTHDGILYRQVNKSYGANYEQLIQSGLYNQLQQKGWLIDHVEEKTNLTGDASFYTLLKPAAIPVISYPYEWCFDQLKDAALLTLQIAKEALSFGMILKDATAFNVQFDKGKPIFIDTLSFEQYDEQKPWIAYRQFCEQFYAPLALMHYLQYPLARLLLTYPEGIPVTLASKLLPLKSRFNLNISLHIHLQAKLSNSSSTSTGKKSSFSKSKLLNILNSLQSSIESFQFDQPSGAWSGYYEEALERTDYISEKKKAIEEWIVSLDGIKTAFDAGANEGLFSLLLSNHGIETVSADGDHFSINRLYNQCKQAGEKHILPLVLDLTNPTPAIGVNNAERPALTQRIHTDLVLALAVIHHLTIGRNIPFSMIAEMFRTIGDQLIIEFVPKDDPKIREMLTQKDDIYDAYSEANFLDAFSDFYKVVRSTSISSSGRKLFLMKPL